jgi:hypothetical protein
VPMRPRAAPPADPRPTSLRATLLAALALALSAPAAMAATDAAHACPGNDWQVTGAEPAVVARVCDGLTLAGDQLAACGLDLPPTVRVRVVDALPVFCGRPAYAVFETARNEIVLATPEACLRERRDGDIFDRIEFDAAYRSIIVHEATHAAVEAFGAAGPIEHEYIAGVMQLQSLPPEQRARLLEDPRLSLPVETARLNPLIYGADPLFFATMAYAHNRAADDPCGLLRGFASGEIRLPALPGR